MKTTASFEEILMQKMRAQNSFSQVNSEAATTSTRPYTDQDPAHMAFLMGQLNKTSFRPQAAKIYPQKPRPPAPPHALTARQQQAYEFLQFQGASLAPNFSQHDLKKAFRAAALKLHPDRGGNATSFIALKEHYDSLKGLFAG